MSSGSELHPSAQHYIHLLKERSVAEAMARYTAARCRAKEAVVLHVPVPESVVALARDRAMSWDDCAASSGCRGIRVRGPSPAEATAETAEARREARRRGPAVRALRGAHLGAGVG